LSGTNRKVDRRAKLASGACSLPVSNFVAQPANDSASKTPHEALTNDRKYRFLIPN
jgi:hypothetical protein